MKKKVLGIVGICTMVLAVAIEAGAQQAAPAAETADFTIPEGTEFKLQLHSTISSKTSKAGDRVVSTLYDPVYVYDENVLPKGTRVDGHIGEVKPAARRGKGGYLTVVFDSVELPNGEKMAILGSLTEIFSSDVGSVPTVGVEGDLKGGGPSRKKQLAIIAIPTLGGAAVGVGPAILAGMGGAAAAYILPRGKQAALSAGALVGMRLDRDVTFTIPVSSK